MIKRYHIPATLFFLLCTTTLLIAQKSIYTFRFENNYSLPPMKAYINMEEIAGTYQTLGNLYTTVITLYNLNQTQRKLHQKALKKALTDLNFRIMTDPKLQKVTPPVPVPGP